MKNYEKQKSNKHNQQPGRIKRIIAALGLAALAVAIPSSESQQLTREDIISAFIQSDAPVASEYVIPTINPKKQGINPDNPRLDKTISIDKPVISVTHPGFIINGIRVGKEGINDGSADLTDDFYEVYAGIIKDPNFWQYWHNSQELVSSLDASSHTCIFNIEDSDTESYEDWNGPQGVISYVQPPKKCFVMTTEQSSGELFINGESSRSKPGNFLAEKQNPELWYNYLKRSGVDTIYVSGEFVYNPGAHDIACLGETVLQYLNAGFEVKGIEGLVYPGHAPDALDALRVLLGDSDAKRVITAVYNNMSTVDDVIATPRATKINLQSGPVTGVRGYIKNNPMS